MKKHLFSFLIAFCGVAAVASANDYCCDPNPCDPCCNDEGFSGFYIGGNVGVGSHVARRNDLDGFLTDNAGWSTLDTSFVGGVQAGYDYQWCNAVVGIVGDWTYSDFDKRTDENPNDVDGRLFRSELDWFSTIRARAGLTVGDALVYVTGGAAVGSFDNRWADDPDLFHHDDTRWGWTGGVGTEIKFCGNWSLGGELLFLHFADKEKEFTESTGDLETFRFGHNDSVWVGRIMVNYRFSNLCCW